MIISHLNILEEGHWEEEGRSGAPKFGGVHEAGNEEHNGG